MAGAGCLHELFGRQAAARPEATALIHVGERVSYGELNARADRVAGGLVARGVPAGRTVGICLERGIDLVVAVLGVLKAGCAYTMLDPAFPDRRLAEVVAAADAATVLAEGRDLPRAVSFREMARYDGDASTTVRTRAADPACVMFTSGSTGAPKGILTSHAALVATLVGQDYTAFGPDEVWLQCSPVSWDAFALELFGPLLSGGVCVLQSGGSPEPAEIAALVVAHAVTTVYVSASLLNFLLDEHPAMFAGLRQVLTGGERASLTHIDRLLRGHPGLRVVNGYSPAENTIFTCCHTITPEDVAIASIPVGRVISNKAGYVLDDKLAPVAAGTAGELYMAGAGLAYGYVGAPGQTAERFVPDPFGGPGERMYRTGDLVRERGDGALEFLGRADQQIKVRGFRVEPAEIEAVLTGHSAVAQAVVVPFGEGAATRLVAYVVGSIDTATSSATATAIDEEQLRTYAAERLPSHLVPSRFLTLPALPRTATGKLDRAALPAPERGVPAGRAAQTPEEKLLCDLFGEVLGLPEVRPEENFFALGGDSLAAARVVGRLGQRAGIRLTARTLFDAPTAASLAVEMERARPTLDRIERRSDDRPAPLSPLQTLLWIADRLQPGTAEYVIPIALRIRGPLDRAALAAALAAVVRRHEPLRTRIVVADGDGDGDGGGDGAGEPVLVVDPAGPVPVPVSVIGEADVERFVSEQAERGIDLAAEAPLRAALGRIAADDHVLTLCLHHIAADDWSVSLLAAELAHCYGEAQRNAATTAAAAAAATATATATATNVAVAADTVADPATAPAAAAAAEVATATSIAAATTATAATAADAAATDIATATDIADLADLPVSFSDVAVWQRERAGRLDAAAAYWRDRLAGMPTIVELPADHPRPARRDVRGARREFTVPAELVSRATAFGRERGATAFMVLLAAFTVLVERSTGMSDFGIGTPVAGRDHPDTEPLIGLFVNTVVLRADLSGRPDFGTVVGRTRETVLDALQHQELPLDRVVEVVRPVRGAAHNPLVQLDFALRTARTSSWPLPGLEVRRIPAATGTSKFDLLLDLEERPDGSLAGVAEYATALFEADTVDRLVRSYLRVLEEALEHPELPVARLALVSGADRALLAGALTGADPVARSGGALTLPEAVARQCRQRPDAIALDDGHRQLTYRELDVESARIAEHLAAAAGAEARVAVHLPRSVEAVVAALGVLRAGQVVVPCDAGLPAGDVARMLAAARPDLVISGGGHEALAGFPMLSWEELTSPAPHHPEPTIHPHSAAYVVFTAGTTGTPKPVVLTHANIAALAAASDHTDQIHLLATPPESAAAVLQLWGALASGARVVLHPQTATSAWLTTGQLHAALEPGASEALGALRTLVIGAEPTGAVPPQALIGRNVFVEHVYGTAEATGLAFRRQAAQPSDGTRLLGRPAAGVRVYVLDDQLEHAPIGVVGELMIAGVGVARGYPDRPGLTAQAFVADPFVPSGRMLRTGDLARVRADGEIEFLGRRDERVTVRGLPVSLSRTEERLLAHPDVEQAVVVARERPGGDRRLTAYVVGRGAEAAVDSPVLDRAASKSAALDPATLRRFCLAVLPPHQVPTDIVVLAALPLGRHGTVDRRALPDP